MGRKRGTKKPQPLRGVKKGIVGGGGGVVLGKKMLGRKREADIQKTDFKLQQEAIVKVTRDARLEALGFKMSGSSRNTQRKKAPVLKPPAGRPRSVTIYKAKPRGVAARRTAIPPQAQNPSPKPPGRNTRTPPQKGADTVHKKKTTQTKVIAPRKVVTPKKLIARKTTNYAAKVKAKILKSKAAVKAKNNPIASGPQPPKPKRGRVKGMGKKRGAAQDGGGGTRAKKMKLSIPNEKFLLSLVCDFDITLRHDPKIEKLAAGLKDVKPVLPVLNAKPKSVHQSKSPVPVPGPSRAQSQNPSQEPVVRPDVMITVPSESAVVETETVVGPSESAVLETEAVEVENLNLSSEDMFSVLQGCQNAEQVEWLPSSPGSAGVDMDSLVDDVVEVLFESEPDVVLLPTPPVPSSPSKSEQLLGKGYEEPLEPGDEEEVEVMEYVETVEIKDTQSQGHIDLSDLVEEVDLELEETEEHVDDNGNLEDLDNEEEEDDEIQKLNGGSNVDMSMPINYGGNFIRDALAAKQKSGATGTNT